MNGRHQYKILLHYDKLTHKLLFLRALSKKWTIIQEKSDTTTAQIPQGECVTKPGTLLLITRGIKTDEQANQIYLHTCNIRGILVGNQLVDHSDVVGAAQAGASFFILDLTPGLN